MNKDVIIGGALGGWIGSVVSIYTRNILPTENFFTIILQVGFLTLIVSLIIGVICKKLL